MQATGADVSEVAFAIGEFQFTLHLTYATLVGIEHHAQSVLRPSENGSYSVVYLGILSLHFGCCFKL